MQIRKATPEDVPALLGLIRELAAFEKLTHEVSADTDLLYNALFTRRAAHALVGEEDGEAVAFAIYFFNFSTFLAKPGLYLEDLFVRPAHRGRGYGEQFLKHLAGVAEQEGCGRFEWAVLDWNENAIRFYRRLGAQAMHDWTVFRLNQSGIRQLAKA
jgi:GNAT superfamily N-acetyltransferase